MVREAVKGDDVAVITRATDDLQKASHAMAQALYKVRKVRRVRKVRKVRRVGEGAQGAPNRPAEGEVVDAEFAETK